MKTKTYYQCDCRKLTDNEDGLCSEYCRTKYYTKIKNMKQNHVLLPEPKFDDIDVTLFESSLLHITFREA